MIPEILPQMGIPHLITYLRPYAKSESLAGRDVIVDGPGLCYHIHHKCLGRKVGARNALEAAPSYDELGEAAIEWLEGLRTSGAVVKRIYFDGFLPPTKLTTRLKRLETQTRQSNDFYNAYPIPCRAPSENRESVSQSIFAGQTPRVLTSLPPPPFLVPAILEALGSSEYYKPITEVVPGEADLYCARYLKKRGGVIFTGDSDLLIHDLGSEGAVTFFRDIEVSHDDHPGALRSQIYRSAAIADRLGLPKSHGLLALAFEMFMDNHGTFSKLVAQATSLNAIKIHKKIYEDFHKEYIPLNPEIEGAVPVLKIFRSLDPRISEIVIQFPALAKAAGQDAPAENSNQGTPHMFLPFLLDCPTRTSAWEMSTSVRQLAYGLINLVVPEDQQRSTVYEHRRRQKNTSGREWQLPGVAEIPDACMAIVNRLDQLQEKLSKTSQSDLWLAIATCQDVEWSSSLHKPSLSHLVTAQLFDLQDPIRYHKNCSWDIVQFLAHIQGSYYSFRILKQITNLVVAHDASHSLTEAVWLLHRRLHSLPGFCDVPDLLHVRSLYQRIEGNNMSKIAREILGIEELVPAASVDATAKSPRKKRKRKGAGALGETSTVKKKSTNLFELLDQE